MTHTHLLAARERSGLTQETAAHMLGVSQSYLSLLEKGKRRVTAKLAHKAAQLYGLPVMLPLETPSNHVQRTNEDCLASDLSALGYPGFSYLRRSQSDKNPAEVLVSALQTSNLESRLTEALPWLLLEFPDLDWQWLTSAARVRNLQNRLGFLTGLARRVAEKRAEQSKSALLAEHEALLEQSRLAKEDTLCQESLTRAEKSWLKDNRTEEAKHWGLLTDLSIEHLSYAD